jgi:hypothetical protein
MISIKQDDFPNDLKWRNCRKKALVVKAVQMDEDFVVRTLEGDMYAYKGDYLLMGYHGELYPCRREIFEETYCILAEG